MLLRSRCGSKPATAITLLPVTTDTIQYETVCLLVLVFLSAFLPFSLSFLRVKRNDWGETPSFYQNTVALAVFCVFSGNPSQIVFVCLSLFVYKFVCVCVCACVLC